MTEPTPQESVLSVFRGHAAHLNATSEKAAAREYELNDTIPQAEKALAELQAQITALNGQAEQLYGEIQQMVKERDEKAAQGKAAREQGAFASSVIELAERSATVTRTDGEVPGNA